MGIKKCIYLFTIDAKEEVTHLTSSTFNKSKGVNLTKPDKNMNILPKILCSLHCFLEN